MQASIPRPSSTTTASWARRRCSRAYTRSIRRKILARTMAVRLRVPRRGRCATLYIVEATPRRDMADASGALDKSTNVYIDTELCFEPYVDTYDQKGHLWRTHIYWLAFRDRPVPDARVAIYPFKREFVVGAASIDTQGNFCDDVLSARPAHARARMLVHQHGSDRQGFLHGEVDGGGGSLSASSPV